LDGNGGHFPFGEVRSGPQIATTQKSEFPFSEQSFSCSFEESVADPREVRAPRGLCEVTMMYLSDKRYAIIIGEEELDCWDRP
jgi:hypothetical protein